MIFKMFALKDEMNGFDKPTLEVNENVALRNFKYAINSNEYLTKNANDYSLWLIGEFDSEKGQVIISKEYPKLITNATSVLGE